MMAVLEFLFGMTVIGLIGTLVAIGFVGAWAMFETTDLWDMIRDRIEGKEK